MARKLIIDTDPGVDDAMAILFAMQSPQLDVIGLTTTFGNVCVERATENALILAELGNSTAPVAQGVSVPLQMPPKPHAEAVHGDDGLGNIHWPASQRKPLSLSAAEFIIEQVRTNPGQVTLIALGPLGNLAQALTLDPQIADLVDEVILMGGAAQTFGNMSPVAEANIFNDPHAADQVFTAPWKVTMIGLDVTHQVLLTNTRLMRIQQNNPKIGDFLYRSAQFYIDFYRNLHGVDGCYFHDASTIAYALDPSLFKVEPAAIRVACEGIASGQTIVCPKGMSFPEPHWDNLPLVDVCMQVDSERMLDLFEQTLSQTQ
ncbi:nucleoside hydrolase [Celerinatantimonas yamalensis]|uniref:Nucleoside hydrolase n=2 Tax=Celerinatantimonas yamalensis TaxID=559956 RepID=A0ABW9G4Y1_9GAMM